MLITNMLEYGNWFFQVLGFSWAHQHCRQYLEASNGESDALLLQSSLGIGLLLCGMISCPRTDETQLCFGPCR